MNFKDINEIVSSMDMDEQYLVLTSLFYSLGPAKIHQIIIETAAYLRENLREDAAGILDRAADNMTL